MDKGKVDFLVNWMRHTAMMTEVLAEEAYNKYKLKEVSGNSSHE